MPDELVEAAKIDGCGAYKAFFYIMLPLAKTGLMSLLIFQFMWGWNDYFLPLLLISDDNLRTVPLAITHFQGVYTVKHPLVAGCITITSVPIIIVFIIFQRKFTEGITLGAIKG